MTLENKIWKRSQELVLLLFVLFLVNQVSLSQPIVFSHSLEVLDSAEKREALVKYWQRRGYQIDSYALANDSIVLKFSDFTVLCRALKRKKDKLSLYKPDGSALTLYRDEVFAQLKEQHFSRENAYSEKDFKKILGNKRKVPGRKRKDYFLYFGKLQGPVDNFELTVFHKHSELLAIHFIGHETNFISDVPYPDLVNCSTVDAWTRFNEYFIRELQANFIPHRPFEWRKKTREYLLYFEQGSAAYDPELTNSIVDFMNDSNLVVKGADIEAFSSIEGSTEINQELQEKRAAVFIETLQQINGDSIPYRLEMSENWEFFENQLSENEIPDTLNREGWKVLAQEKPEMESLLAEQRYARIKLYFKQKEAQANAGFLVSDQLKQMKYGLRPTGKDSPEYLKKAEMKKLSRLMSLKRYLYEEVTAGRLDSSHYCEAIDGTESFAMRLVMLHFYDEVRLYESDSCLCDMEELAINTFRSALDEYHETDAFSRKNLEDVHAFIISMIISGDFSPELACDVVVPDEPRHHQLTLNNLKLLNEQVRRPSLQTSCTAFDDMYRELLEQGAPGRIENRSMPSPKQISFALISYEEPEEPVSTLHSDSRYYYLLKTNVLRGGGLKPYVERAHWSFDFDVFELMEINVMEWNAVEHELFDKDLTERMMHEIFSEWISSNPLYCRNEVMYIASLFYAKIFLRSMVSRQKHSLLDYAVGFLEHFYANHIETVHPQELKELSDFLLMAQVFYFKNERMKFHELIQSVPSDHIDRI
jgi:hypothetical protein